MNKTLRTSIIFTFLFAFIFSACGGAQPAAAPEPEAPAAEQPTAAPTLEPTPTQAPPPPVCMIAFDSERDNNLEIYMMGPDGSNPVNLSNNPGEDRNPAMAPDGSAIAFVSNRDNGQGGGQFIYVARPDISEVKQITQEPDSDFPDWSHDGKFMTYTSGGDIFVINADGSGQSVNMTNSPETDIKPSWSPDGSKIAWLSGSDGNWNIFVMYADGSNVRQLTTDSRINEFAWTVDNQIFFNGDLPENRSGNFVFNDDGTGLIEAGGKGDIQRFLPFWTLDGHRVECNDIDWDGNGQDEIYLIGDIFPDMLLNITNSPGRDRNPSWPANCGPREGAAAPAQPAAEQQPTPEQQPAPEQPLAKKPGEIVLGYAGDNEWDWLGQRKANFQKACNELGLQCIYAKTITELIDQGASAVVVNSNNCCTQGMHNELGYASEKNVPAFVLDAEWDSYDAYYVTINHQAWASVSLDWMFKNSGGKGQVAIFDTRPFDNQAGIDEMTALYPDVKVIATYKAQMDYKVMEGEVRKLADANPGLTGIWASGEMASVIWGFKGAKNADGKWPMMNCEASREGLEIWQLMLDEGNQIDCFAATNPPGIAYDAAYAAFYAASGLQVDPAALGGTKGRALFVPFSTITNDNLAEWLKKTEGMEKKDWLDEWMTPEEIKEKWFLE